MGEKHISLKFSSQKKKRWKDQITNHVTYKKQIHKSSLSNPHAAASENVLWVFTKRLAPHGTINTSLTPSSQWTEQRDL